MAVVRRLYVNRTVRYLPACGVLGPGHHKRLGLDFGLPVVDTIDWKVAEVGSVFDVLDEGVDPAVDLR
jgi:hypothetical protein